MARKAATGSTDAVQKETALFSKDAGANTAKMASLQKALGDITKRYGDGTVMRLGEATHLIVETIPTGSLSLDIALGVGGVPRGRITEIYGPESSGRKRQSVSISSLQAQKMGRNLRLH